MPMSAGHCAVVDYGMGNLHSAGKALARVAPDFRISIATTAEQVSAADHIVLPGVGAIRGCLDAFSSSGMRDAVLESVAAGKPLLAICIGMQLLLDFSEENGGVDGLGLLPGSVHRLVEEGTEAALKVPHMGWNTVEQCQRCTLWKDIPDHSYFYFVHSYCAELNEHTVGRTDYGRAFTAAIARDNVYGVQFHPEKSGSLGMQLLRNFLNC